MSAWHHASVSAWQHDSCQPTAWQYLRLRETAYAKCSRTKVTRTPLGAPGLTTRNKKLLGAPGITSSKDATRLEATALRNFHQNLLKLRSLLCNLLNLLRDLRSLYCGWWSLSFAVGNKRTCAALGLMPQTNLPRLNGDAHSIPMAAVFLLAY